MVKPLGPLNPFYIDDAEVIYPWFSGKETPMNRKGDRNFGLVLNQQQADHLRAAGYNVKIAKRREATDEYEEQPEKFFVKCKVNFNSNKPPRVVMITCIDSDCTRTPITEEMIVLLDSADIEKVDCKIGPYDWENASGKGRTAYVQSLFVHVNLDKYDQKYADMPLANGGQTIADALGEPSDQDD